jgi:outer membrane protein assembly factor BamB
MKMRPRRVIVLAVAVLLAACTAEVAAPRPTETPSATPSPTATPRPTNAVNDVIYLRSMGSGGVTNILAIDARTGATLRTFPDGSPSLDRSTLLTTEEASGGTQTVVRRRDLASGRELGSFGLSGTYHAVWNDGGQPALSRDGQHLALSIFPYQENGEWVTGYRVVDAASGATEATLDLKGKSTYGFVAMSPDGRSLYLNGPLALSPSGDTDSGTRVFNVPSSTLLPATAIAGAVKQSGGFRTPGVLSPDGRWMFSLDAGAPGNCTSFDGPRCTPKADEQPHVLALDLVARRVLTVPLPMEQKSTDFEKYLLWSVAVAPDGATVYAINPALGFIDEIDARQMTVRRTSSITVSRADEDLLAAVGRFFFPVADAKRYITSGALLSPNGDRIYAAGSKGIAVVNTSDLSSRAVWQSESEFDSLALTADGERLYAVSNANRKIAIIATRDGTKLGELVLPAFAQTIVHLDSSR